MKLGSVQCSSSTGTTADARSVSFYIKVYSFEYTFISSQLVCFLTKSELCCRLEVMIDDFTKLHYQCKGSLLGFIGLAADPNRPTTVLTSRGLGSAEPLVDSARGN